MPTPDFTVPPVSSYVPFDRADAGAHAQIRGHNWPEFDRGEFTGGAWLPFLWAVDHGLVPRTPEGFDAWRTYIQPASSEGLGGLLRRDRLELAIIRTVCDLDRGGARRQLGPVSWEEDRPVYESYPPARARKDWNAWAKNGWVRADQEHEARLLFEKWLEEPVPGWETTPPVTDDPADQLMDVRDRVARIEQALSRHGISVEGRQTWTSLS